MRSEREDVIRAIVDILPETLLAFGHGDFYDEVKQVLVRAVEEAPVAEARALQNFAAEALETFFEKKGYRKPEIARTFLAKVRGEMGME